MLSIKNRFRYLFYAFLGEKFSKRLLSKIKSLSRKKITKVNLSDESNRDYRKLLKQDPINAELHFDFANRCVQSGNYYLAYAELSTAQFLGKPQGQIKPILENLKAKLSPVQSLTHNQYFRLFSLAEEIKRLQDDKKYSILDVGGGDGKLAWFLPQQPYCLAEPSVNGISGTDLPFKDKEFDVVVSCHVLEHIPLDERELFLDNLVSKAKKAVVLLNPFEVEGTYVKERLNLFISITNAQWAKEHLDCSLPSVESIQSYAQRKGLTCDISPNGNVTTTMAMVFVDYFAKKADCVKELEQINKFYNQNYMDILNSEKFPNAYLVTLKID